MTEEIYVDDLECPNCDTESYCESWEVKVNQHKRETTKVKCEHCGNFFEVQAELQLKVSKLKKG